MVGNDDSTDLALTSLGFTDLESRLYSDLLRHGPASGYRLAQRVGKAAANVYQSLTALTLKGAVFISDDLEDKRTYVPNPPRQLLKMLETSFCERRDASLRKLESIYTPQSDERVYSVRSVALIFERVRVMLASAKEIVLIDFFPEIYALLRAEVDAARARGVTVAGIAYRPDDAGPGMPLNRDAADMVSSRWPGVGLIIIVDGCQYLVAQLSRDLKTVLNGVWTDSVFLSCVFHSAVAADIRLVGLSATPPQPMDHLSLRNSSPPGMKAMAGASGA